MFFRVAIMTLAAFAALPPVAVAMQDQAGVLYGRVVTRDGQSFEGFIRWDKNEGSWNDILNGTKELVNDDISSGRRSRLRVRRLRIDWDRNGDWPRSASSGIRFGHISTLKVVSRNAAVLTLKSGREVSFGAASTDIGRGVREILVDDRDQGIVELDWSDLDEIRFADPPAGLRPGFGERIYGTVQTRDGLEFTGYVTWDVDEIFSSDVIDGNEGRRRRKVPFSRISRIERESSSSARITLTNGQEMVLRGTNDVNRRNRGILVWEEGLGSVQIDWGDFASLSLAKAPGRTRHLDGGKPITGTVYTENGRSYTGQIKWDNDEEYTWEFLDGDQDDLQFQFEFASVKSIEKISGRRSKVTTMDGRAFEVSGSNDVDRDNKGIFITLESGDVIIVDWDDFQRAEFTH